jgi:NADH-quinone oxidoreductase subunit M
MKKLVAYSSVSHLGFVVLGIFSFNQNGLDGAVYQMLNHGISTGALFMLVGYLYERTHSLEIKDYGGVSTPAPALATIFFIATLASIGLPTLNNFIGEYLVLQGSAAVNIWWTVFAATGVVLSAGYMLWLYQRAFFGETNEHLKGHMHDISLREFAAALPLLVLMVWMGTYTKTFLPAISAANARILEQSKTGVEIRVDKQPDGMLARLREMVNGQ